jgi:(p)ppGpp synthase/HD superfamily hydrolase
MNLYTSALIFATKAHSGQKRLNGDNYIIHPIRVSQEVKTENQKAIALLHDVIEDSKITFDNIKETFGDEIANAVECLTHRKGESYDDYIGRVLTNQDAVQVKIADICDNLSDSPSDNAIKKSSRALARLVEQL